MVFRSAIYEEEVGSSFNEEVPPSWVATLESRKKPFRRSLAGTSSNGPRKAMDTQTAQLKRLYRPIVSYDPVDVSRANAWHDWMRKGYNVARANSWHDWIRKGYNERAPAGVSRLTPRKRSWSLEEYRQEQAGKERKRVEPRRLSKMAMRRLTRMPWYPRGRTREMGRGRPLPVPDPKASRLAEQQKPWSLSWSRPVTTPIPQRNEIVGILQKRVASQRRQTRWTVRKKKRPAKARTPVEDPLARIRVVDRHRISNDMAGTGRDRSASEKLRCCIGSNKDIVEKQVRQIVDGGGNAVCIELIG